MEEKKEAINHPNHYNAHTIEVIDITDDWQLNFNLGNCVKYVLRAPYKNNQLEDLKKAKWYLNHEIERLEKQAKKIDIEEEFKYLNELVNGAKHCKK